MGRELKRVPMGFDWPQGEIWEGYVNPYHKVCEDCGGHGTTPARKWLDALVRLLLIAGAESLEEPRRLHPSLRED